MNKKRKKKKKKKKKNIWKKKTVKSSKGKLCIAIGVSSWIFLERDLKVLYTNTRDKLQICQNAIIWKYHAFCNGLLDNLVYGLDKL
jgi:hypothetical protein